MRQSRRKFLINQICRVIGTAFFWPAPIRALSKTSSSSGQGQSKLEEAMLSRIGTSRPIETDAIHLELPDIAEDGALVPLTVESSLSGVESLYVFVEKNPNPFAASFRFGVGADAFASLRIKMNESCDVIAVAKTAEGYYGARRKVRVLLGGCG